MELSGFSRLATKIAGLFMIAISLNHLPSNLITFMGAGSTSGVRFLLGIFMFVPSLIAIAVGAVLVLKADAIVDRAFNRKTGEAAGPVDGGRALEEMAIFLLGIYIFVISASELGYYFFNYFWTQFQSRPGSNPYTQAIPLNYGGVFTYAVRFLLAFGLMIGAKNLSILHRRIQAYRPMKDLRDV